MFLYTVSGNMVDKYTGTSTPLRGYQNCFTAMAVMSLIGFVCGAVLRYLNKNKELKWKLRG